MSAVNTDEGTILEALNDKLDRDANNLDTSTTNFDMVVDYQIPTAENNYTWYRKYKSGWVEQGGQFNNTARSTTINLPITMANTKYIVNVTQLHVASDYSSTTSIAVQNDSMTTTSFIAQVWYNNTQTTGLNCWEVKGMTAA